MSVLILSAGLYGFSGSTINIRRFYQERGASFCRALVERRREELRGVACPPLHGKLSLLPGGNLAHVACDAVVNASNHMLTPGKGDRKSLWYDSESCGLIWYI